VKMRSRRRRDEELDEEIRSHLRMAALDRVERGETPQRAEASAPGVVIINEAFARRQWPGEEAVGKRINVNGEGAKPREVVGVVRDVKQGEWASEPRPEMYLPHTQAA
jgi:MacB-like periplasmic core domain